MPVLDLYKKESGASHFVKFSDYFDLEPITSSSTLSNEDIILQNKGSIKIYRYDSSVKNITNKYKVVIKGDILGEKYLTWLFNQEYFNNYLSTFHKGSVIFFITKRDLLSLEIPFFKGNVLTKYTDSNIERSYFIVSQYQMYKKLIKEKENYLAVIIAGVLLEAILYEKLVANDFPKGYMKNLGGQPLFQYCVAAKLLSNTEDQKYFQSVFEARNLIHYSKHESSREIQNINKMIASGLSMFDKIYDRYIQNKLFLR